MEDERCQDASGVCSPPFLDFPPVEEEEEEGRDRPVSRGAERRDLTCAQGCADSAEGEQAVAGEGGELRETKLLQEWHGKVRCGRVGDYMHGAMWYGGC